MKLNESNQVTAYSDALAAGKTHEEAVGEFYRAGEMPVNPHTGLYNVTEDEVQDARAATEDVILVREDGTLTKAGQLYVADVRRWGHEECETCHPRNITSA